MFLENRPKKYATKLSKQEILSNIDNKVKLLVKEILKYTSNGEAIFTSKGILNNKNFLSDFESVLSIPNSPDSKYITNEVYPSVFHTITYLPQKKVLELIENGYSQTYHAQLKVNIDQQSNTIQDNFKRRIGTDLKLNVSYYNYSKMGFKDLYAISERLKNDIRRENKKVYLSIVANSLDIAESSGVSAVEIARTLFQWANGYVLNNGQWSYKISLPIIQKCIGSNTDLTTQYNGLGTLNFFKSAGLKPRFLFRMISSIMNDKKFGKDSPSFELYIKNLISSNHYELIDKRLPSNSAVTNLIDIKIQKIANKLSSRKKGKDHNTIKHFLETVNKNRGKSRKKIEKK